MANIVLCEYGWREIDRQIDIIQYNLNNGNLRKILVFKEKKIISSIPFMIHQQFSNVQTEV